MNEEKKNVSRKILDGWKEEISYNIGERGNFIFDGRAHNDLARALGGGSPYCLGRELMGFEIKRVI